MSLGPLPGYRHKSDDLATDLVPALTRQAPRISRPRSVFPDFATDLTPALTPHITPAYAKGPVPAHSSAPTATYAKDFAPLLASGLSPDAHPGPVPTHTSVLTRAYASSLVPQLAANQTSATKP